MSTKMARCMSCGVYYDIDKEHKCKPIIEPCVEVDVRTCDGGSGYNVQMSSRGAVTKSFYLSKQQAILLWQKLNQLFDE